MWKSNIISKLLGKRGLTPDQLTPEEKKTLDSWEGVLSTGEITVDSLKQFCENQVKRIETSWKNLDNTVEKNQRLIIQHTVYSTLLSVMTAPALEKKNLEQYLEKIIED